MAFSPDDEPERITIEVYPDYIETIIIALQQKAKWHLSQGAAGLSHKALTAAGLDVEDQLRDEVIVRWINQIIADLEEQT